MATLSQAWSRTHILISISALSFFCSTLYPIDDHELTLERVKNKDQGGSSRQLDLLPLHAAACDGKLKKLKKELNKGHFWGDYPDRQRRKPLDLAIKHHQPKVVRHLVLDAPEKKRARVNAPYPWFEGPLHQAIRAEDPKIVRLLIKAHADVNASFDPHKIPSKSTESRWQQVRQFCSQLKEDYFAVQVQDQKRSLEPEYIPTTRIPSPLEVASTLAPTEENKKIVELLLNAGANIKIPNDKGELLCNVLFHKELLPESYLKRLQDEQGQFPFFGTDSLLQHEATDHDAESDSDLDEASGVAALLLLGILFNLESD